jgi:hypothetical protein
MAAAPPLNGKSFMIQMEYWETLAGSWRYSMQNGDLRLEFEYKGSATSEAVLEVICTIKPDAV